MVVGFWFESEFGEDGSDVGFDGLEVEVEAGGDGGVGASFRHEAEHVAFSGGEWCEGVAGSGTVDESGDDFGVDDRAACGEVVECFGEFVDVADTFLEEVADAAGAVVQ
jgi:hypothetical protein